MPMTEEKKQHNTTDARAQDLRTSIVMRLKAYDAAVRSKLATQDDPRPDEKTRNELSC
jgi:hypothetical protein